MAQRLGITLFSFTLRVCIQSFVTRPFFWLPFMNSRKSKTVHSGAASKPRASCSFRNDVKPRFMNGRFISRAAASNFSVDQKLLRCDRTRKKALGLS